MTIIEAFEEQKRNLKNFKRFLSEETERWKDILLKSTCNNGHEIKLAKVYEDEIDELLKAEERYDVNSIYDILDPFVDALASLICVKVEGEENTTFENSTISVGIYNGSWNGESEFDIHSRIKRAMRRKKTTDVRLKINNKAINVCGTVIMMYYRDWEFQELMDEKEIEDATFQVLEEK